MEKHGESARQEGVNTGTPTLAKILKAISDDKSLDLFKIIASERCNSYALLGKIKLSRKQYYSRTADFIKAGLVKRKSGKYFLTTVGKIVCNSHTLIEIAINNYWKLKAIDSLIEALSQEEYTMLVNTLLDNNKIKEMIFTETV